MYRKWGIRSPILWSQENDGINTRTYVDACTDRKGQKRVDIYKYNMQYYYYCYD